MPQYVDPYAASNAFARQVQFGQQQNAFNAQQAQQATENSRADELMQMRRTQFDQQQQQIDREQATKSIQTVSQVAQRALGIADPAQRKQYLQFAVPAYAQDFAAIGANVDQGLPQMLAMPDDQLDQRLKQVAALAPAQAKEGFTLGEGQTRFDANGKAIASVAAKPSQVPKPPEKFRAMTPAEIQAAGLPAGTSAQVGLDSGKIDVLSKRDTSATLSQKDATAARIKLNTIKVARQQLNRIRDQFEGPVDPNTGQRDASKGIKGTLQAGPESRLMVLGEGAQKFDAAVNQMRSTLTSLTRTPGVGSMSDYETKLDQSKFPDRLKREGVTEQQLSDLDDFLNLLESGYSDLLNGGNQAAPIAPTPPGQTASQPEITATGPNGRQLVLRNGQWVPK